MPGPLEEEDVQARHAQEVARRAAIEDGRLIAETAIGPVPLPILLHDGHPLRARPHGEEISFTAPLWVRAAPAPQLHHP